MNRRTVIVMLFALLFALQTALLVYLQFIDPVSGQNVGAVFTCISILMAAAIDFFSARFLLSAITQTELAHTMQAAEELDRSLESYRTMAAHEERMVSSISQAIEHELAIARQDIASGHTDEANSRLRQSVDLASEAYSMQHDNIVITAILAAKKRQCAEENIQFTAKTSLPPALKLTDIELASLVLNLIDHTLHSCATDPRSSTSSPTILVRMLTEYDHLLIEVEGTPADVPALKPGSTAQLTRRNNVSRELRIVNEIAERYGGTLETLVDGDLQRTSLLIPLR